MMAQTGNSQFEFHARRVNTEGAHRPAACRYDSADDQEEEEERMSGEFFDLNNLSDDKPADLFAKNCQTGRVPKHDPTFERRTFKTTSGNNRYSQNLRSDDEDELTELEDDLARDVEAHRKEASAEEQSRQYAITEGAQASLPSGTSTLEQRPPRICSAIGKHKLEPKCMLKLKKSHENIENPQDQPDIDTNGAQFQYQQLVRRLSEMSSTNHISKIVSSQNSSGFTKRKSSLKNTSGVNPQPMIPTGRIQISQENLIFKSDEETKEPPKQQFNLTQKQTIKPKSSKPRPSLDGKAKKVISRQAVSTKGSSDNISKPIPVQQTKGPFNSKLLLGQEMNFIEKQLQMQQVKPSQESFKKVQAKNQKLSEELKNPKNSLSQKSNNSSSQLTQQQQHQIKNMNCLGNKSGENKSLNKVSSVCQINNLKLSKNQVQMQQPFQQTQKIRQTKTGKTQPTTILNTLSTKQSSTLLTQCSSIQQLKETPDLKTQRQKVKQPVSTNKKMLISQEMNAQESTPAQSHYFSSTQKQLSKKVTDGSKMIVKNPIVGQVAQQLQGSSKKEFNNTMFKNLNQNQLQQQRDGSGANRTNSKTSLKITQTSHCKSKLAIRPSEGSNISTNKTRQRVQQQSNHHNTERSTSGSRTRRKSSVTATQKLCLNKLIKPSQKPFQQQQVLMTALQAQTNAKPQKTGPKSIMIAQQIKKQTSKQDLDMDKENFNSNRKTQQELLQVSQVIEKSFDMRSKMGGVRVEKKPRQTQQDTITNLLQLKKNELVFKQQQQQRSRQTNKTAQGGSLGSNVTENNNKELGLKMKLLLGGATKV